MKLKNIEKITGTKAFSVVRSDGETTFVDSSGGTQNMFNEQSDELCTHCVKSLPIDDELFSRQTCCGKSLHKECLELVRQIFQWQDEETQYNPKNCPYCFLPPPEDDLELMTRLLAQIGSENTPKPWAQYMVGELFLSDLGKECESLISDLIQAKGVDIKTIAREFLQSAADQGYAKAQLSLASMDERS